MSEGWIATIGVWGFLLFLWLLALAAKALLFWPRWRRFKEWEQLQRDEADSMFNGFDPATWTSTTEVQP